MNIALTLIPACQVKDKEHLGISCILILPIDPMGSVGSRLRTQLGSQSQQQMSSDVYPGNLEASKVTTQMCVWMQLCVCVCFKPYLLRFANVGLWDEIMCFYFFPHSRLPEVSTCSF